MEFMLISGAEGIWQWKFFVKCLGLCPLAFLATICSSCSTEPWFGSFQKRIPSASKDPSAQLVVEKKRVELLSNKIRQLQSPQTQSQVGIALLLICE